MTIEKGERFPHLGESATSIRFSLSNEMLGTTESVTSHPTGQVRVLKYPTPDAEKIAIQNKLIANGLIIGKPMVGGSDAEEMFRLPKSARLIKYDASEDTEGLYTYNDEQMFYDLGDLLAETSKLVDKQKVIVGDIGLCIALTDFVRPGERHLFLVPGIENAFEDRQLKSSRAYFYMDQLKRSFGDLFDDQAMQSFHMGYNDASI